MAIGDKLSELMSIRNTNPNRLSKATGVNVNTIYGIIRRNNTKVDLDDLQSICDELGVNLDYFAEKEKPAIQKDDELPGERKDFVDKVMALDNSRFRLVNDIVDRVLSEQEKGL